MSDDKRVVWVLGSGFSVPLGGPMLKQLLSRESREDIRELHELSDHDPGVYWLYHYGRKFKDDWHSRDQMLPGAGTFYASCPSSLRFGIRT